MYNQFRQTQPARLISCKPDGLPLSSLLVYVQAALLLLSLAAFLLNSLSGSGGNVAGAPCTLASIALLCAALLLNASGCDIASLALTLGIAFALPWIAMLHAFTPNSGDFTSVPLMVLPVQLALLFLPVRFVLPISFVQVLATLCLFSQMPRGLQSGGWWVIAFVLMVSLLCVAVTQLIRKSPAWLGSGQVIAFAKRGMDQSGATEALSCPCGSRQLDDVLHSLISAPDPHFGLLMIDLDYFRFINEAFGYLCGNDVLQSVTDTLAESIREQDILIRGEGGSFAVLLAGVDKTGTLTQAEALRKRITDTDQPDWCDQPILLTASIGAAHYPENGNDSAAMLRAANFALAQAKQTGRNRVSAAFTVG